MSAEFIKFAFAAGEISPTFHGRGDLEKFDLGLAEAYNWFVDYAGGVSTRPGLVFDDYIKSDHLDVRFSVFRFAPDEANNYLILWGHHYIRFIQNGAYVLEAEKTITDIDSDLLVEIVGHGFSNGDWVRVWDVDGLTEVNERTFQILVADADTFTLLSPYGELLDASGYAAYVSGGKLARIYTIGTNIPSTDLAGLRFKQRRDLVRVTSNDYPVTNLIRTDHTDWTFVLETIGNMAAIPSGLSAASNAAEGYGLVYTVTAVFADGTESSQALPFVFTNASAYVVNPGGYVRMEWTAVPDAISYNVYRSIVHNPASYVSRSTQLGYLGKANGPIYVDTGETLPDFAVSPPAFRNPFVNGAVEYVTVTGGGSGYSGASTVSITGDGTGFRGFPIVNSAGAVVGVKILDGGVNYTTGTVSFTGGTGATATATFTAISGNNPAVSTIFQQRQLYAGTQNKPLTINGTRVRKFANFDESEVLNDGDAYEFELDSEEVAPIRHMVPARGGLILMTESQISLLSGGTAPVTPLNAVAEPQSANGAALLEPVKIGTDIVYLEGKGTAVRLLEYNDLRKVYGGLDISILSSHFFTRASFIVSWDYQEYANKILWAVRSDGGLNALTIVKDQEVFAWTGHWTRGFFYTTAVLFEGGRDVPYFIVERYVNGRWSKFLEHFQPREFSAPDEAFCVDCGLSLPANYPAAGVQIEGSSGTVTVKADASVFTVDSVGDIIRQDGAKLQIVSYVGADEVTATFLRAPKRVWEQHPLSWMRPAEEGEWTLDTPITEVGGLWHLEGETVTVLGDGGVMPSVVVENGKIELIEPVTRAAVGLPYTCRIKTLPIVYPGTVVESKRKRVTGVAMRLNESSGLKVGYSLDSLYLMKSRTVETYGEPPNFVSGMEHITLATTWNENAQIYFVQENPLPATLLGFVFDFEVGDDPD